MASSLPHTRNSTAGRLNYEPVVGSQFQVFLLPPAGIDGGPILTEHVTSIEGMFAEDTEGSISQKFQTAGRAYDTNEGDTVLEITVNFSLNLNNQHQNYVYKTLKGWKRKQRNPMTGERGLKVNYIGQIIAMKFDRDGTVFWTRTANQVFIKSKLPDLGGNYGESEPQALSVTFSSDWLSEDEL